MYPNPCNEHKRKRYIVVLILTLLPALMIVGSDMRSRILNNDLANLIRQSIIMVSVVFTLVKLIITIIRKKELREIIVEINEDYQTFNELPEECQDIAKDTIQTTKTLENLWIGILAATASSYPILACVCTIYSQVLSNDPKRYMVHETELIFVTEEKKYETPYFEAMSIYTLYVIWIIFLGFAGYDGLFSVCILHVSLKIKLFSLKLQHILDDAEDVPKMKANIANFVEEHCGVIRLIEKIQKCFEVWLVGTFFNAVVQIGMALCQITSNATGTQHCCLAAKLSNPGQALSQKALLLYLILSFQEADINAMYYFYAVATAVHIYVPCHLASDVTQRAAEVATVAYSSSWESLQDAGVKRSIAIIIARAQIPIHFKAMGMLTFNMEMFVSIMQTSYSMYTLLRT
ncbi:jg4486 [Pararge aegeria aegeria]|uniref:Odorant receptor n=1 Tax=Pararge aegeria aegeria TaxID=348720 RepID=A0A8S4S5A8_9NEOP|nr:jg4486 [Pararge aegeria aegeria]